MDFEKALTKLHIIVEDEYERERVEKQIVKLKNRYCEDKVKIKKTDDLNLKWVNLVPIFTEIEKDIKKQATTESKELIKGRIRNQLRIHWHWLKKEDDYTKVADFIDATIKQVTNVRKRPSIKLGKVRQI